MDVETFEEPSSRLPEYIDAEYKTKRLHSSQAPFRRRSSRRTGSSTKAPTLTYRSGEAVQSKGCTPILMYRCPNNTTIELHLFWVVLGLCLIFLTALRTEAQEYNKNWFKAKFDVLDQAINNGDGYSKSTNEEGTLAWAESYLLEAYLDMYEVTNDSRYLDIFATQAKRVAENTDKLRGIQDFQGRSRTGWSAKKYSIKKERMVHVVQTGMILYPMVRFALIVKEDSRLERYSKLGSRLVSMAEEAVAELDGQWRFERTGEGSYWFNGNEPIKADLAALMPFNGSLALGKVILLLHRLTGREVYLNKAKAMALLFKKNLLPNGKNGYVWGYRPDLKKYSKVEDLNHGAIDVGFAVEAFNSGILFTREDDKFSELYNVPAIYCASRVFRRNKIP